MKWIEGDTSAEMRQKFIAGHFVPLCRRTFAEAPSVQSVVFAVAQYWADEADDAVHFEFVPCVVENPTWPACLRGNPYVEAEMDGGQSYEYLSERGEAFVGWRASQDLPNLDDNSTAITAFASCCSEMGSQEDPISVAYEPYAIARRAADGTVAVEIVGGVKRPEWEDRFDVGLG